METIKNYLDNMFLSLPQTPETIKAKSELLSIMEDKYNELKSQGKSENEAIGIVISEFGNLDELAEELGIRGYMNNGQGGPQDNNQNGDPYQQAPMLSMDSVREYLDAVRTRSKGIALGVFLCICSPILLIILGGLSDIQKVISEQVAGGVGIVVLLAMIAIGVGVIIMSSMGLSRYEYLQREPFQLDNQTFQMVNQLKYESSQSFAARITLGVVLCIIAVIPVVATAIAMEDNEIMLVFAVGLLLFIVAIAVTIFITTGMVQESYRIILQLDEYSKGVKNNKLMETISGIYWPIVTCAFLGYSFITGDWGRSWIIWPVAGVLFGAISCIVNAVSPKNNQ